MADVLRVKVEPESLRLTPGAAAEDIEVRVFNGTQIVDEFTIAIIGSGQWLTANTTKVRLFPDTEEIVKLNLSIPKGQFVPAGERAIGVQVTSSTDPNLTRTNRIVLFVEAVSTGESLRLEPQVVRSGRSGRLLARVFNGANTPMNVALTGEDPERAVTFRFHPEHIQVPPNGEAQTWVKVSARRPFFGSENQRQLTVHATGGPGPLTAQATLIQEPLISSGFLGLLRLLLTLAGAAGLILGSFLVWTNAPARNSGVDWTYTEVGREAFATEAARPEAGTWQGIFDLVTSVGFLFILFGVVALLGLLGSGKATRTAGILALLFLLAFFVILRIGSGALEIESGAWVVLGGAGSALIAGFFASG